MRVVCLIRNVAPECYGGGETYQLELAEMLKKNGYCPYIISSSRRLLKRGKELGFEVVEAPYNVKQNWSGRRNLLLPEYFLWQKKLQKWYSKLFSRLNPEVVNIQSRDDWIAATTAAKKLGIKILWTDHMDFRGWVFENVKIPYKNFIGKWILRYAKSVNEIIMISDYEKKFFDDVAEMDNVIVAKNGAIDQVFKYKTVKAKKRSFVYVGRVIGYKGISELIRAFKLVRKEYPEAILYIYGAGEISRYRQMAGEGVKFCGETSEPLKALAENEIFVLPSYKEGLSLSLLDAAMMGKTIIATNVDGNSEVVEDGVSGLLVPAKNVEKLAEAMKKVLAEPKLAKSLAEGAREKYETEFNFEKIFAEKMLPLYNNGKEQG